MSGTKPYIAPEIFLVALDECIGYSYPADWWSLGVTLFEILARGRPFDIHSHTSVKDMKSLINSPVHYPSTWSDSTKHLLAQLLITDPKKRLSNAVDLTRHSCLQKFNMETIMEKQIKPGFTPPRDHLNCDPTFELEEMIVEARPLHKKKKRLAKQRSLKQSSSFDIQESDLEEQLAEFRVYNRERELIRRALEKKENDWEAELIQAMNESTTTR
uniref:Serine/threonine-protein kinase 32B n=1 Tax=Cacopsylla melanoneura TaxID=428564 RepID=A0A8D8RKX5_9HEMI